MDPTQHCTTPLSVVMNFFPAPSYLVPPAQNPEVWSHRSLNLPIQNSLCCSAQTLVASKSFLGYEDGVRGGALDGMVR